MVQVQRWNLEVRVKRFREFSEDLRKWFDKKDPQGGWKRIGTDGSVLGPCVRPDKDGDGDPDGPKPKCMSNKKIRQLTKKQRAAAVRAKRKYDKDPDRKGKPINVSNFGKGKL